MINFNDKRLCFALIAEGNKEAFDLFFKHYYPKLVRFAKHYVLSLEQAEDVVADVLTHLLSNRTEVFRLDYFESYLFQSVKNKALNAVKYNARISPFSDDPEFEMADRKEVTDPYEILLESELQRYVVRIVQNFPEKRRIVFQLVREEGFTYRQVAELMNISERTVEVHLKLAVKDLRNCVERFLSLKKVSK